MSHQALVARPGQQQWIGGHLHMPGAYALHMHMPGIL
jgi:hypothetical protein